MPIPSNISETLLPKPDLNVVDLCRFTIPQDKDCPDLLALSDKEIFSTMVSMVTDGYVAFLQSLPMPTPPQLETLQERLNEYKKENSVQSLSYCFRVSILRLPLWVLDYWMEANIVGASMEISNAEIDGRPSFRPCGFVLREMVGDITGRYDARDTQWPSGQQRDSYTYANDTTAAFIRRFAEKLKAGEVSVVGMMVAVHYKGNKTEHSLRWFARTCTTTWVAGCLELVAGTVISNSFLGCQSPNNTTIRRHLLCNPRCRCPLALFFPIIVSPYAQYTMSSRTIRQVDRCN